MPIFQTKAGRQIYKSKDRAINALNRAIKKAWQLGEDTLIVEDEYGKVMDCSFRLRRYAESKALTPVA